MEIQDLTVASKQRPTADEEVSRAIATINIKDDLTVAKTSSKQRLTADEEVSRTFATIKEMLTDRGLDVTSFDTDKHLEIQEVVEKSHSAMVFEVDIFSAKMRVIYNLNTKYKTQEINKLKKQPTGIDDDIEDPEQTKNVAVASEWQYLVVTRELPMQGKSSVDENTQIFRIDELLVNITKHVIVPRHIPIRSQEEINSILQMYSLKIPQQVPLIQTSDPIARYLALKPGELVRIERPSPSAGTYVLYRCCVVKS